MSRAAALELLSLVGPVRDETYVSINANVSVR